MCLVKNKLYFITDSSRLVYFDMDRFLTGQTNVRDMKGSKASEAVGVVDFAVSRDGEDVFVVTRDCMLTNERYPDKSSIE